MRLARFWRIVFIVLLVVVTYLTVTPNPDTDTPGHAFVDWIAQFLFGSAAYADKVAHFAAYLALGGAFVLARAPLFGWRGTSLAFLAVYGALLEVVQGFTAVRSPEVLDAAANAAGTLASYPLAVTFERMLEWIFGKNREEVDGS